LAISPPSDIVLDVARAVGPDGLDAARQRLATRSGASASGADATFSLSFSGSARSAAASRTADAAAGADTFRKFEAVVLQSFVQAMLPKEASAVYGEGFAGDMWKSMMATQLADALAARGGIGIAASLATAHYRDGDTVVPVGQVSDATVSAEADSRKLLSTALVQEFQRQLTQSIAGPEAGADSRIARGR
jgi:Rod binding domain-containing protein